MEDEFSNKFYFNPGHLGEILDVTYLKSVWWLMKFKIYWTPGVTGGNKVPNR
jgi:hypothetical protein